MRVGVDLLPVFVPVEMIFTAVGGRRFLFFGGGRRIGARGRLPLDFRFYSGFVLNFRLQLGIGSCFILGHGFVQGFRNGFTAVFFANFAGLFFRHEHGFSLFLLDSPIVNPGSRSVCFYGCNIIGICDLVMNKVPRFF